MKYKIEYDQDGTKLYVYEVQNTVIEINKMRDGNYWMASHQKSGQDCGAGMTRAGCLNDAINVLGLRKRK